MNYNNHVYLNDLFLSVISLLKEKLKILSSIPATHDISTPAIV